MKDMSKTGFAPHIHMYTLIYLSICLYVCTYNKYKQLNFIIYMLNIYIQVYKRI